jgi:hypothetical protein
MEKWEDITRDADEKKLRGEETGPLPSRIIFPKRHYSVTVMEDVEDISSTSQT